MTKRVIKVSTNRSSRASRYQIQPVHEEQDVETAVSWGCITPDRSLLIGMV
ncbi:hypothetical protein O9929_13675 [Vibrio lentus]|nr:hypothetical protein [Vibrio lentus]